jgi:hypothetical protein
MGVQGLSEIEREVLRGLWEHQRTSLGGTTGGTVDQVAVHVRASRGSPEEDNVEREVAEAIESLERMGDVTKVDQTADLSNAPIYGLTSEGLKQVNG